MSFELIDMANWVRKEHYLHFMNEVVCSYSVNVQLNITNLKGYRLYPAMLWLLTRAVNQMPEFRTSLSPEGPGIFEHLHPAYTVFNQEQKTFSSVWTEYQDSYQDFQKAYEEDVSRCNGSTHYIAKPDRPANSFDVSMIPWLPFSSLNYNVYDDGHYLLPIFTIGKYEDNGEKRMIPLAIQVHHAVCDGYHLGRFVDILQAEIDHFTGESCACRWVSPSAAQ